MCLRAIAKAVHFGLNNRTPPGSSTGSSPAYKPAGTDGPSAEAISRRVFMSRFADYELHDPNRRSLAIAGDAYAGLMNDQGLLPAYFDFKRPYTNDFVDQITTGRAADRGAGRPGVRLRHSSNPARQGLRLWRPPTCVIRYCTLTSISLQHNARTA